MGRDRELKCLAFSLYPLSFFLYSPFNIEDSAKMLALKLNEKNLMAEKSRFFLVILLYGLHKNFFKVKKFQGYCVKRESARGKKERRGGVWCGPQPVQG